MIIRKYFSLTVFVLLYLLVSSCTGESKTEYNYVETAMQTNIDSTVPTEKKPLQILAVSDSDAYIQAYTNFCFSHHAYENEFQKSGAIAGKPLSFKLLNKESIDISKSVNFLNKERIEQNIEKKVSNYKFKVTDK